MKKKLIITLSSVLIVIALIAIPVLANGIPGWLEPFWMPDPLEPGAEWWRDTTNQNALAQYYNDIYPQLFPDQAPSCVVTVGEGVYAVRGIGKTNVIALIGDTEFVIIDAHESPNDMYKAILMLRPYLGTRSLNAIIYTSEDRTHYSGSAILGQFFTIPTWASDEFFPSLLRSSAVAGVLTPRNLKTYGVMLPEDPDWRIGPATTFGNFPFHYPNRLVSEEEVSITLAGFNIKLIPAVSATDGGLLVWLPDQKVLISGDAWSPSFPNIGPLTGPSRSTQTWTATLDSMLALNPDYMIPTHGPVISSNAEIQGILTNYRDAMKYVHDRTLYLINTGLTAEDAAVLVELPEQLASDPYLQQFIADIPSAVKSIAQQYVGWFNGEPPELASSLTTAKQAEIMVKLGGGLEQMLNTAKNAELEAGDQESAEEALLLAWAAYTVAPDNELAIKIYAQALRKNAYMQQSNQTRNYYLTTVQQIEQNLPEVIEVSIDIKPGSDPNSINLGPKGVVPVAVLTSPDFDAGTIDPETVLFADASPEKWSFEDLEGDGDIDMLFHFNTEELNLTESSTEAILTGRTTSGQDITGTDSVRIVPVKGKK